MCTFQGEIVTSNQWQGPLNPGGFLGWFLPISVSMVSWFHPAKLNQDSLQRTHTQISTTINPLLLEVYDQFLLELAMQDIKRGGNPAAMQHYHNEPLMLKISGATQ